MPDIFLSYAHVDKHWVDNFAPLLEQRVNQYAGRSKPDRLWKDNRLTGNQTFSHEIQQQLNNAHCLVACFSVGYFMSEWCMHELTEFTKRVGQHTGMVFCIELDELVIRQRPAIAGQMLGYPFWRFDNLSRRSYPLYPNERAYEHLLTDLSKDIAAALRTNDTQTAIQQQTTQHQVEATAIAQDNITQVTTEQAPKQLTAANISTASNLQARQDRLHTLISRLQEQYDLETRAEEQMRIQKIIEEKQFLLNEVQRQLLLEKYQ